MKIDPRGRHNSTTLARVPYFTAHIDLLELDEEQMVEWCEELETLFNQVDREGSVVRYSQLKPDALLPKD